MKKFTDLRQELDEGRLSQKLDVEREERKKISQDKKSLILMKMDKH